MAAPTPAFASISILRSDLEAPPAPTLLDDFEDRPPEDDAARDRLDLPNETEGGGSSLRVSMSAGSAHDISPTRCPEESLRSSALSLFVEIW